MNIEKNISEKSFFDEMYGFINEIIKTYNTQYNTNTESKIFIKHDQIQNTFNKNKIISNYQKYKIFFTFDDIENYYNDINNRTIETIDCTINNEFDDEIDSNNTSNNNLDNLDIDSNNVSNNNLDNLDIDSK